MSEHREAVATGAPARGLREVIRDWSQDVRTFPLSWGKAMMWMFILSDIFVFGTFLAAYAGARMAATLPWPDTSKVFALHVGEAEVPLLLIAIMTFVLISSSGTMALAVASGHQRDRGKTALFLGLTTVLGLCFLGMQAFEWSKLIHEGFRPWANPEGAPQFGAAFFTLTGFHGLHVTAGVIYLASMLVRVLRGVYDRRETYEPVEIAGLYWHFVDLVWVFIFAFLYLI